MNLHRPHGFTLLEMLLAISLLTLLAGLTYGVLRIGVRGWEAAELHADSGDALHVSWPFLYQTLEAARPVPALNRRVMLFTGNGNELTWVSDLPAHLSESGLSELKLSVEPAHDDKPRQLVLRHRPLDSDPDDTSVQQQAVLVDDLDRLKLSYFGTSGPNQPPGWEDSWEERDQLPLLIRVDISPTEGEPWPTLYAQLRLGQNATTSARNGAD